jgi:hypothetical protein
LPLTDTDYDGNGHGDSDTYRDSHIYTDCVPVFVAVL